VHHCQDMARLEQDSENDCRRGYVGRWVYKVRVLGPHCVERDGLRNKNQVLEDIQTRG
jgi:hypothetical protein